MSSSKKPVPPAQDPVTAQSKTITFDNFISDLGDICRHEGFRPFCFLLGAGASRNCDIPTGQQFVDAWLRELYERNPSGGPALSVVHEKKDDTAYVRITRRGDFQSTDVDTLTEWAKKHLCGQPNFDGFTWDNRAAFYGAVYSLRFQSNRNLGQAALREAIVGARPKRGYILLSQILAQTSHRLVLTTNFDRLTEDAAAITQGAAALTLGHEKLATYLDSNFPVPIVAKVHGDIYLETYNAADDIHALRDEWKKALRSTFDRHNLIILGYGGNDPGLMTFLAEHASDCFKDRTIYWCYYEKSAPPTSKYFLELLKCDQLRLVPIPGFDDVMPAIYKALTKTEAAAILTEIQLKIQAAFTNIQAELRAPEDNKSTPTVSPQSTASTESKDSATSEATTPGRSLREAGKYREALPVLQKEWDDAKKEHGPDAPNTWEFAHQYACGLWRNSDLAEGEALARLILALRQKNLGPEHGDTLSSINLLANLLLDKGDFAAAEPLFRRALETYERTLDPEHPDTLRGVNNLANLLFAKGDLAAAEPLYRRALEARERTLGPERRDTCLTAYNFALFYASQNNVANALQLAEQALKGFTKTLGVGHEYTIAAKNLIDELKKKQ